MYVHFRTFLSSCGGMGESRKVADNEGLTRKKPGCVIGEGKSGSVGGDAEKLTKLQGKTWILSPSKTPLYCCQVKLIKTALQRLHCISSLANRKKN